MTAAALTVASIAVATAAEGRCGAGTVVASWYGKGVRTASGERFHAAGHTAAHRTCPFGTRLRVSVGPRSVVVRITDRGPLRRTGRDIDLSRGAAQALGIVGAGMARVQIEPLSAAAMR